ncbi:MAG: hypothetical protein GX596_14065 [Propionibacterium sp.]|nr:hypothetical protein [Propionibacterium sp.]
MRLWSLDPGLLDRQGLTAAWREALLAQKVLRGETRGYRNHPQLQRFRAHPEPVAAIASFLDGIADAADDRGYRFDRTRIVDVPRAAAPIDVTAGQLRFEWRHLLAKLAARSPDVHARVQHREPKPHPLFRRVDGDVEDWERGVLPQPQPTI